MSRPSRPVSVLPAAVGVGLAVALPLLAAAPASAQEATPAPAQLTVVHGVRGLVADVRMDDRLVLSGFAPERVTDTLSVPAGTHHLQAWPTGAAATSTPVVDTTITLTPGEVATAGIGLDAAGKPVVTLFDDGGLLPNGGSTALAVRGLAKSDPVNVVAGNVTLATGLAPTQGQSQQVQPGTYPVSVVTGAGSPPVVPPQDVPVAAGRATVLYLIGSQTDQTLGWVAQTVRPDATAVPLRVDTGVGPIPSAGGAATTAAVVGLPVALLALVAARSRRRAVSA